MNFQPLEIAGAFLLTPQRQADDRGFFARTFCAKEFAEHGLDSRLAQCSVSFNARRSTLRGMHYQASPHEETKLVRVTAGAIYDVILDVRPGSKTFRRWQGVELSAENRQAVCIPPGVAHGFLTLADATEIFYQMSEFFHPESSRGVRWDDPAFGIRWPMAPAVISPKDRSYPDFKVSP